MPFLRERLWKRTYRVEKKIEEKKIEEKQIDRYRGEEKIAKDDCLVDSDCVEPGSWR